MTGRVGRGIVVGAMEVIPERQAGGAQLAKSLPAVFALTACALILTLPGRAAAATVTVIHDPAAPSRVSAELMEFRAAPGERNVLTATGSREFGPPATLMATEIWRVQDSGAVLTAAAPCEALDPDTVVCRLQVSLLPYFGGSAQIDLGDLDDVLQSAQGTDHFTVDGGPGNDRLVGTSNLIGGEGDDELRHASSSGGGSLQGGAGDDQLHGTGGSRLDGGGGRDAMYGGWTATDGDTEGAGGDAGPGADRFVKVREISYQSRHAPISTDLRRGIAGQAGERDIIDGARNVVGGSGNDRLLGDERGNILEGGPGYDRLFGRDGNDWLSPSSGGSRLFCGPGNDTAGPSSGKDWLYDCESVLGGRYDDERFPSKPRRTSGGALRYPAICPGQGSAASECSGEMKLREASGRRRLLAKGTFPATSWPARHTFRIRLTPAGRAVAGRRRTVAVTFSYLRRIEQRRQDATRWTAFLMMRP